MSSQLDINLWKIWTYLKSFNCASLSLINKIDYDTEYMNRGVYLLNLRLKPAAIADLLMINEKLNKKFKINNIPKYNIYTKKNNVKAVFLQDIQYWLIKKYKTMLSINKIDNLIKFD